MHKKLLRQQMDSLKEKLSNFLRTSEFMR